MKNLNLCEILKKIKEFDSKIGQTPERETVKLTRELDLSIAEVLINYINNNELSPVSDENSPKFIIPNEPKDIEIVGYNMTTGYISYINGEVIINAKLNNTVGPIPVSDELTIPSLFRYFIREVYGTRNTRTVGRNHAEIWDVITCLEVDYTTIYNKTLVIWNPNILPVFNYNVEIPPEIVFYFDTTFWEGGGGTKDTPAPVVSIWKTLEGHLMKVSSAPSIVFRMDTNLSSENAYLLITTNEGDSVTHIYNITTLDGDLLEGEETFNKLMEDANATYILPNPTNSYEHILLKPISVNSSAQLIFVKGESVISESHPSNNSLYDLYRGVVIFNLDTNSIKAQLMKDTIQINIYQESEQL